MLRPCAAGKIYTVSNKLQNIYNITDIDKMVCGHSNNSIWKMVFFSKIEIYIFPYSTLEIVSLISAKNEYKSLLCNSTGQDLMLGFLQCILL